MIEYRRGDMFKGAPKDAILCHPCNTQGTWEGGIAAQFAEKYPDVYNRYTDLYYGVSDYDLEGTYALFDNILCIFGSKGFGYPKDDAETIIENMEDALNSLGEDLKEGYLDDHNITEIHSPKINSGLFGVPWTYTEVVINNFLKENPGIRWVVWEL